ncbi:hypothetical protein NKB77_004907 [Salmonella enterica]|nr:hypothetical protein [Salmonella enterica]
MENNKLFFDITKALGLGLFRVSIGLLAFSAAIAFCFGVGYSLNGFSIGEVSLLILMMFGAFFGGLFLYAIKFILSVGDFNEDYIDTLNSICLIFMALTALFYAANIFITVTGGNVGN